MTTTARKLALVAALTACHTDALTKPVPDCACAATTLTVVNGNASALTVLVNGVVQGSTVAPGSVAHLSMQAGASTVVLRPVSGAGSVSLPVIIDGVTPATALAYQTVAGAFAASVLTDSGATGVSGASKLRIIHLAQNAGRLDAFRTQPDWSTPISFMFPFNFGANTGFYQSTPGNWHVRVWKSTPGLDFDPSGWNRALDSLTVNVPSGGLHTLVMLDAPGGTVKLQLID